METLKHQACIDRRWGSATLSQLAFPGEGNPNFAWEKYRQDNTVVKGESKKEKKVINENNNKKSHG